MIYNFGGSDPGDSNYGYSVINVDPSKKFAVKILELGMFTCQINNITNKEIKPPKSKRRKTIVIPNYAAFNHQYNAFSEEWEEIFDEYQLKHVTTERFQARGLRGKSIECVSMMNAIICGIANKHDATYDLPTAASWKNQVNRQITLDDFYKEVKKSGNITPHTTDSVFIAVHGALIYFGLSWNDIDVMQICEQFSKFQVIKE